ncbi:DENN domain-containing protein 5B [Halotydeus destructor]|nr:DENN domain-containing protein 5B [Halotydeus destructor]
MAAAHLQFLEEAGKLKHLKRTGWVIKDIQDPERVASHMYRMAIMAMSLKPVDGCDMSKVVQMALVHDLAECKVGDITPHDNVTDEDKHRQESDAMSFLTGLLSNGCSDKFSNMFHEYEDRVTPEAKLTKDLDRFDMILQAFEYERRELKDKGTFPDLSEFFDHDRVTGRIENDQVKELLTELVKQRAEFYNANSDKVRPNEANDRKMDTNNSSEYQPSLRKKDRQKLVLFLYVFSSSPVNNDPNNRTAKVVRRYSTTQTDKDGDEEEIDDSSLAMLCLPDGIDITDSQSEPKFHTFVITRQTGQRIHGSALIVPEKIPDGRIEGYTSDSGKSLCSSKAYCMLSAVPFVIASKKLLLYIWKSGCEPNLVQAICDLKMPRKGQCIRIRLPSLSALTDEPVLEFGKAELADVYVHKGSFDLPLFDYPLRKLFFEILSPDQFFMAFTAALFEFQILITSEDYFRLMLVAEALTTLLQPFKWQHVYVPILPSKLGLHYLDAPTPYIMGIKPVISETHGSLTSMSSHSVQCRIDCDANHVEIVAETHTAAKTIKPPFIKELIEKVESILKADIRLAAMSSENGVNPNGALKRVVGIARKHNMPQYDFSYIDDQKLNQDIRLVCMETLRNHVLSDYERFIVISHNKREPVRFDVVSYLCDQPDSAKPFLMRFMETQMFASFIDESASKIRRMTKSIDNDGKLSKTPLSETLISSEPLLNPKDLDTLFGCAFQVDLSEYKAMGSKSSIKVKVTSSPMRQRLKLKHETDIKSKDLIAEPTGDGVAESVQSPAHVPSALTSHANWCVVESLLREAKVKTKRILLEKMGNEEVAPLGCGSIGEEEDNILIASLCDLIERAWSHGVTTETSCHFWSHLIAYARLENASANRQEELDDSYLSPALHQLTLSSPNRITLPSSPAQKQNNNIASVDQCFRPLPTSLFHDIRSVLMMNDVKTDLGRSRAFIRLALERKLLSQHLKSLLSNQELLTSMYKRYAFLRSEEEREQFLTHMLTLNAVDLYCFTNTFTTSFMRYKLYIFGSGSLTGWISVGGSLFTTNDIALTTPCATFAFKHKNLGSIKTLSVCVSQQSKIYIDFCFIRNEFTGHVYQFTCKRWLGQNIDDHATERVMIGKLVDSYAVMEMIKKSHHSRSSSIGRHWSRSVDDSKILNIPPDDLQELLRQNVSELVKFYCKQKPRTPKRSSAYYDFEDDEEETLCVTLEDTAKDPRPSLNISMTKRPAYSSNTLGNLSRRGSNRHSASLSLEEGIDTTKLLYGDKKLLWTLQQVLYFGFKNRSKSSFRKQLFLWDFILRLQVELKLASQSCGTLSDDNEKLLESQKIEINSKFLCVVEDISNKAHKWGKDGKLTLFLAIALREHLLVPHFISLLSKSHLVHQFYDTNSFLVSPTRTNCLIHIMSSLTPFSIHIDPALTKNL